MYIYIYIYIYVCVCVYIYIYICSRSIHESPHALPLVEKGQRRRADLDLDQYISRHTHAAPTRPMGRAEEKGQRRRSDLEHRKPQCLLILTRSTSTPP